MPKKRDRHKLTAEKLGEELGLPTGFMRTGGGGLAKRYPDTVYDDAEQRRIFEYTLGKLLASIDNPERAAAVEAHRRDAFEAGDLVYINRFKVGRRLFEDGRIVDVKDVADHEWFECDEQPRQLAIGRADDGWYVLTPEAFDKVADAIRS